MTFHKTQKVAVISINYNQADFTISCVNSILSSSHKNLNIILIDNNSDDKSQILDFADQLKSDKLLVKISKVNLGYIGGVNLGLELGKQYFSPDYFLIMNNDTIIDVHAISKCVNTCKDFNDKAIVTGKVYHYNDNNRIQYIGNKCVNTKILKYKKIGFNEIDNGQYNELIEMDMIDDIFWLFSSKLYEKIGGYSDYFWFNGESADFALRAKNEGYKLIYEPQAKIWHKGSITLGERKYNPKLAFWHIQSTLIFRYLHLNKWYFSLFLCLTLRSTLYTYLKSIKNLFVGNGITFKYANAKFLAIIYFISWTIKKYKNTGYNPFLGK